MIRFLSLLFMSLTTVPMIHAWKSAEAKGEQPIFFGTLVTQEGNKFNVTNVSIGRSRNGSEKIVLYEKPKNLTPSKEGNIITVNPSEDLTTTTLELQKISRIEVPQPYTIWTWTKNETTRSIKMKYEFIDLLVTWRSGSKVPYLLELGTDDTTRPVKVFCDVIDKKMAGIRQNGTLFCPGITKTDVRKKGAPFQAIKSLTLEEPCYKLPDNTDTMKQNNDDE